MSEATSTHPWGRVDEHRTVYVREHDGEREVGQFPDGTQAEALAYYVRKFEDLAASVTLLEARVARGVAAAGAAESVAKLQQQLVAPSAVGNLDSLRARVQRLDDKVNTLTEQQRAEREAAKQQAIERCERIVAEAERLAAQPQAEIRWKETGQAFERLLTEWRDAGRGGSQPPKSTLDSLWKRFRTARHTFDVARRAHFAQLDAITKEVKQRKEHLIARAEALSKKGADAVTAYRQLLHEWKQVGRANRKVDEQLWERFQAAGDVLYQAKNAEIAQTDAEYAENLTKKQQLLDEHAAQLLAQTDHVAARKQLTELQLAWDAIGKVRREAVRDLDAGLKKLETHVKRLEDEHWQKTNPETRARSEQLRSQLERSIAELKREIAQTTDTKQRHATEQKLASQESWLAAIAD